MFRSGRRFFSIAATLMILTAVPHTLGFLSGPPPEWKSVLALNAELRAVFWTLVFTMSITFAALGAINLLIAAVADDRVIRLMNWANFAWVAAFGLLSLHYWVAPPMISAAVIEVFVLAAIVF
jgi:hypothetical protein